jgi:hypothetical protein
MMSDNRATIIGTMVLVAIVIFLMIFAPTLKLPDLIVIVFCVIPGLLFLLILKSRIVRYLFGAVFLALLVTLIWSEVGTEQRTKKTNELLKESQRWLESVK